MRHGWRHGSYQAATVQSFFGKKDYKVDKKMKTDMDEIPWLEGGREFSSYAF